MPICTVYVNTRSKILSEKAIEKVVFFICQRLKKQGSISVHVVGEKRIRDLNRVYRGKDKVTDVLSFGVDDEQRGEDHDWGDIFICNAQIKRQAKRFDVTIKEEFLRMLVHGVLHLFGYDHEIEKDAKVMFPLQEKLLQEVQKI